MHHGFKFPPPLPLLCAFSCTFPLLYLFCNPHSSSFLPDLICSFSQFLHSQYCFISLSLLLLLGSLKLYKLGTQTRHTFHRSTKYLNLMRHKYCRTRNFRVCLYIAYLACCSASLYIKTLYFFITVLALSAAAIVANIKIRYDAKLPNSLYLGHA